VLCEIRNFLQLLIFVILTSVGFFPLCCDCVSITCRCILYWVNSMLGLFGACEFFGGVSVVEGSYSASPLIFVFSLVVFFTAAHVTAGAGGVGTLNSVVEQAIAASSGYTASGLASLRVAAVALAVSVAVGGESYSPTTCGGLWAILVLTNVAFSNASAACFCLISLGVRGSGSVGPWRAFYLCS